MANKAIAIAVLARPLAIPAPLSVNEAVLASQGMQSGLGCIWIPSQVGVRAVPSDSADVVKVGEISHTPDHIMPKRKLSELNSRFVVRDWKSSTTRKLTNRCASSMAFLFDLQVCP